MRLTHDRYRVAATVFVLIGSSVTSAAPRCANLFRDQPSLQSGVEQLVERNHEFMSLAAADYLESHYAELNQRIDHLLRATRDQIVSDVQIRTQRLGELNSKILANIEKVQGHLAPNKLTAFFTDSDKTADKMNLLTRELAFCRGRGETCAASLKTDLARLLQHHEEMKKFGEDLREDLDELEAVLRSDIAQNDELHAALGQQYATLAQTSTILAAQLKVHANLVQNVTKELTLFRTGFQNATRIMMVTTPHTEFEKDLRALHAGEKVAVSERIESFQPGDQVLAWAHDPHAYHGTYRAGRVESLLDAREAKIVWTKRSLFSGDKGTTARFDSLLLAGCHAGICEGEELTLRSGLRFRSEGADTGAPLVPAGFRGAATVIGYNPISEQILVQVKDSNGYNLLRIWTSPAELHALRDGKSLIETESIAPGYTPREGDLVVGNQASVPKYTGLWRITEIRGNVVRGKLAHTNSIYKEVKDLAPESLLQVGCHAGFCTSQSVRITEDAAHRLGFRQNERYVVQGYSPQRDQYFVIMDQGDNRVHRGNDPTLFTLVGGGAKSAKAWVKFEEMMAR